MPIIGLTDEIQPRLTRLGKLRKGGEKTPKGFGPDLDHFRFTSDRADVVAAFERAFGTEPRSILVYTFAEHTGQVFSTWCEVWDKSGLVHRCNGQTMSIWREGDKYKRGSQPCAGGHNGNPRNDAVGRLEVIVPELIEAGFVGTVTMETHSLNDIVAISSSLEYVRNMRGNLSGAAFNLRRVKETISVPGWGNRAGQRSRADKWLVKLEPVAEWAQRQLAQVSEFALLESQIIDGETGEIVTQSATTYAPPAAQAKPMTDDSTQPNNGNTEWTVESALAVTTARGTRLGDCSPEQLDLLIDKARGKIQSAAKFLREYLAAHEVPDQPEADNVNVA